MTRAPRDLVLATGNRDKVAEIRAALAHLDGKLRLLPLDEFPNAPKVEEDGDSLEANAMKKARLIHEATGLPALADDTGLMVDVLNGAPGVYSSRYAGPHATYVDNVKKLLRDLEPYELSSRHARFCTVVAFAHDNKIELAQGECAGTIALAPRGIGKFGYDPVFIVDGTGKTYAEMSIMEKNQISHRGRALRAAGKLLTAWLANQPGARDDKLAPHLKA
jgi:XTP/dITP diphosphohydrolase